MDTHTHSVEIIVRGIYQPLGQEKLHNQTIVYGDGEMSHMLQAFRTALVASGFNHKILTSVIGNVDRNPCHSYHDEEA